MRADKILDSLPNLIYVTEPNATDVIFYNRNWYDYTGLTPEDMKAGWAHIVHPEDLGHVVRTIAKAVKNLTPYQVEVRLKNVHTNAFHWFLSTCTPIFEDGEIINWVGVSTDINQLKELEIHKYKAYEREIELRKFKIAELQDKIKDLEVL